jgi:hypothetical protein
MKYLEEFRWSCACGYWNIGWWLDAEYAECDHCGATYDWETMLTYLTDEDKN